MTRTSIAFVGRRATAWLLDEEMDLVTRIFKERRIIMAFLDKIKQDISDDEAQFIALLRQATTAAEQDAAQLVADAKAAGQPLWDAFQSILNKK